MRLYQPVLFVGLGGTGCDIGAVLERRMREEICGPDGNDFRRLRAKEGMLPYQLPSCVQFVYADMNQAELDRLPRRVVPGPEHIPAAALTAHYVTGLVPDVASYPELAVNLRLQAERVVEGWLPPATSGRAESEPAASRGGPVSDHRPGRAVRHVHRQHRPGHARHPRGRRPAVQLGRGPVRPGGQAAAGGGRVRRVLRGRRDRGRDLLRLPAPDRAHPAAEQQPAGEDLPAGADAVGVRGGPGRRAARRAQCGPGAARPVPPRRPAERRRRPARAAQRLRSAARRPG